MNPSSDLNQFRLMRLQMRSVVRIAVYIGIPLVSAMAIYNLVNAKHFVASLNSTMLLVLILFGFVTRGRLDDKFEYKIYSILFRLFNATVGIALLYEIGVESSFSRIGWCFIYPLLVFFVVGTKEGIIWISIFYGSVALLTLHSDLQKITLSEIQELRVRLLISLFVISVLALFLEHGFRHARKRLLQHQRNLEESENRYRQAYERLNVEMQERKQAEEALRESEDLYRDLVESSEYLICTHDLNGQVLSVNHEGARLLGYDQRDFLKKNIRDLLVPRLRDEFAAYLQTIRKHGAAKGLMLLQTAGGSTRIWEYNNTLRTEGVSSPVVRAMAHDVTERVEGERAVKRLSQENAVMAEIGRIISSTLDINEVYNGFAEAVRHLINFDRISTSIIDPQRHTVTVAYAMGVQIPGRQPGEAIPLSESMIERILKTRSSILVQTEDRHEIETRFPFLRASFGAGFTSMISVPLISKYQVIGALNLRSIKSNAYTDRDLKIAESIGIQISGAIANALLFAERKAA